METLDEHLVEIWNATQPIGTRVAVRRDNGEVMLTTTRSEAWMLGGHTPVVLVKGISGCYLLSRVTPTNADETTDPANF